MDADYTNDPALLANTPAQVEFLLYKLEQAVEGIDLHLKANQSTCVLNEKGTISTLNGKLLKLVD